MDNRIQKMAQVLVNYSVALKPGERLLIRSLSPEAEPLAQALYEEAFRAGGLPFIYMHIKQEDEYALESGASVAQLETINPMLELAYKNFETVIRIESSQNPRALSRYPMELQMARAKHRDQLIQIQMRREAAKELRRCTTQFPTFGYAQTAGMSLRQYQDFLFGACKLNADDPVAEWKKVYASHERLIEWLKGKKKIQVRGEHIDMELSIDGRIFKNAGGMENFPDGEIFTGPVENSVNGWVRFTYPAYYHENEVKGVELEFKDGLVVNAKAETNLDFLLATLDSDPGARRLGEFAIGTNTDIKEFTGSILFDEKIGGTVHMAVGQGYAETGSVNQSLVHWDMICDMRQGGEILVDGTLMYKDGKFVI
ncbi:MAG TPA: aminopeptidase [Aggregatilineaceae bacterium]|nr:aminopeptidase [Aggregatilineaceae bacterium]